MYLILSNNKLSRHGDYLLLAWLIVSPLSKVHRQSHCVTSVRDWRNKAPWRVTGSPLVSSVPLLCKSLARKDDYDHECLWRSFSPGHAWSWFSIYTVIEKFIIRNLEHSLTWKEIYFNFITSCFRLNLILCCGVLRWSIV